jgi:hypothetical protein
VGAAAAPRAAGAEAAQAEVGPRVVELPHVRPRPGELTGRHARPAEQGPGAMKKTSRKKAPARPEPRAVERVVVRPLGLAVRTVRLSAPVQRGPLVPRTRADLARVAGLPVPPHQVVRRAPGVRRIEAIEMTPAPVDLRGRAHRHVAGHLVEHHPAKPHPVVRRRPAMASPAAAPAPLEATATPAATGPGQVTDVRPPVRGVDPGSPSRGLTTTIHCPLRPRSGGTWLVEGRVRSPSGTPTASSARHGSLTIRSGVGPHLRPGPNHGRGPTDRTTSGRTRPVPRGGVGRRRPNPMGWTGPREQAAWRCPPCRRARPCRRR